MTSKSCPRVLTFTPTRLAWPEIKLKERPEMALEEFKSMVEGDWGSIEDRINSYFAKQQVRKEELEFMRSQDKRLADLFERRGSMTHRIGVQIHKEHPMLAALEEYCKKDIESELNTLRSVHLPDYMVGHMHMEEDNEEDPGTLSDLEALTRDDGGVYPDGLDDPMAAIRSFCR